MDEVRTVHRGSDDVPLIPMMGAMPRWLLAVP